MSAKRYIYLDNAAATVPSAEVMLAMQQHQVSYFANPGSIHEPARLAKQRLEQCREGVAKLLNCNSSEVIFSSSGSESNNLAIIGCALANQNRGKHILVSAIEHPSVLRSADRLKSAGFDVEQIPVNSKGLIDKKLLGRLLRDDTILVSVMYANNEIGTIQPIRSLAKLVQSYNSNIVFHTDVCQAVGALKIDTKQLAVDMLSLNGSKIYGPRGVGVVVMRRAITVVGLPWAIRQAVRYRFMPQQVLVEGSPAVDSLRESSALVRGRWWHTAGMVVLFGATSSILSLLIGLLLLVAVSALPLWLFSMVSTLVSGLLAPIVGVSMTLLWGDATTDPRGGPAA